MKTKNTYTKVLLIITIVLFSFSSKLFSQEKDFSLWSEIQFEVELIEDFKFCISEEFRFDENISRIDKYYTNLGFKYRIIKQIRVAVYYRFLQKQELNSSYSSRNKFFSDIKLEKDINRFEISFRSRYQTKYTDYFSSENGNIPANKWRNKLNIDYDIKNSPIKPFLSSEIFYQTNNNEGNRIDELRFKAGMDIGINEHQEIEFSYILSKEINVKNPLTNNIFSVEYSFAF
ncbi:MAG: DUF2490 domain-containing protein [Bacteroidota bacterium]|nr:DUF2490 domain-containing protein [Bacteroidota bacterium]